ncbi:MAG: YraN family protein [Ilumatobacteraceae bacterium]
MTQWYLARGYSILARNWTMRGGELDVVACRNNVMVVCEVKARATSQFGAPLEAITPQKVARVQRAGHAFLREYRHQHPDHNVRMRFDVATVLGTTLEVFENFF